MTMTVLKSAVLVSALIAGGAFSAQAQTTSTDTKAMPMAKEKMEKPGGATSAGPEGNAQNLRGHSEMKGKTDDQPSAKNLRGHSETPKDELKKN